VPLIGGVRPCQAPTTSLAVLRRGACAQIGTEVRCWLVHEAGQPVSAHPSLWGIRIRHAPLSLGAFSGRMARVWRDYFTRMLDDWRRCGYPSQPDDRADRKAAVELESRTCPTSGRYGISTARSGVGMHRRHNGLGLILEAAVTRPRACAAPTVDGLQLAVPPGANRLRAHDAESTRATTGLPTGSPIVVHSTGDVDRGLARHGWKRACVNGMTGKRAPWHPSGARVVLAIAAASGAGSFRPRGVEMSNSPSPRPRQACIERA